VWGKQTFELLSQEYGLDHKTIQKMFRRLVIKDMFPYQEIAPQPIYLVIDAYCRRRGEGTIIFRSSNLKQNLLWRDIGYETIADYIWGVHLLIQAGYKIMGFTIEERRGTMRVLEAHASV